MARTDFDDWYKKDLDQTQDAYRPERDDSFRGIGSDPFEIPEQTGCISSSQCASGFGCVNGKCVQIGATSGNGSPSSPGDCPDSVIGNDCNSGSYACQSSPTCGKGSGITECCGGKITYVFKPGEEQRVEGKCVTNESCHYFCSSRYALFGPPNTDPDSGLTDQCAGKNICTNTDCEECGLFSGICEPKFGDLPCWCNGGASCGRCKACITDPSDSNFGQCAITTDSAARCKQCVEIPAFDCCGTTVGPIKKCGGANFSGSTNDLRDEASAEAKSLCSETCNQCETKNYKSYCSDRTELPGSDLNCPPGQICRQSGSLSIAGVDCVFVEERDVSNCSFRPGRWTFSGIQSYHERSTPLRPGTGEVLYRPVFASFYQGDPDNPNSIYSGNDLVNCADGGCYPVMRAPSATGYVGQFTPLGDGEPWGEFLAVEAVEDGCTGDAFSCGIDIIASNGQVINCSSAGFLNNCQSVLPTECGCAEKTYYRENGSSFRDAHFGPGCSISGTWTYEFLES